MAAPMVSRFKGCLVGGVVGDCIGAVFEGLWGVKFGIEKVLKELKNIDSVAQKSSGPEDVSPSRKKKRTIWEFTDDTAMARSVAKSLIVNNGLDVKDVAKRFTEEFHKEKHRGYGGGVVSVFYQLAECECLDVYGPSRRQFDGQGSYGNGGSMRIAPAGLYAYKKQLDFSQIKEVVEKITLITHSHNDAILGAILQCYAVVLALETDELDVDTFIDTLLSKIGPVEKESQKQPESGDTEDKGATKEKEKETYVLKLEQIRQFVKQEKQPSIDEIDKILGTDISALRSAPTALYCFLRAMKPIEGLDEKYNAFERTIIYAISLGGDTDTIATMAGAIAGAYYGVDMIPWTWQKCCEGVEDALIDAESMYKLS